ncbi:MAG: prolipoprotein diacylglyceryl transferase [Armatimonadetes bacterium]|nr:prolipoprotein diacylglyceryl transferase [Armatimonadota bacterium]
MRPVLVTLGPWALWVLPVLFLGLLGALLVWQWLEGRQGGFRGLTAGRAAVAVGMAAIGSLVLWLAVARLGPVEIKAWGTMLVVAFSAGVLYLWRWGDRGVLLPAEAVDMALYCLVGAVVGSRIVFVALDWQAYAAQPGHILNVWEGGLSYHGGLLGAVLAALVFAWRRGKQFLRMADETAPAIALGYAFARVGCFLNGCCHGHPTDLPWGMVFPHGEISDQPVHPTQLYALLASLAIMVVLIRLKPLVRFRGQLFAAYLALYSVARFLLEVTRAGATGKFLSGAPGLTQAQFASILIFALGVAYIAITWRSAARAVPSAGSDPRERGHARRRRP